MANYMSLGIDVDKFYLLVSTFQGQFREIIKFSCTKATRYDELGLELSLSVIVCVFSKCNYIFL